MWKTVAPAAMVLVRAACRCERQVERFAGFETLLYHLFAEASMPRPPASTEQGDRAGSHRTEWHLSFRSWLARYYGAPERNAPARSQRDKTRLPHRESRDMNSLRRRESRDMNSLPRCEWFRIQRVILPLPPWLVQIGSSRW
jgi:hypothetical protein